MKQVIGWALLILFFVALYTGLVALMVVGGLKLIVAVFIALGTFVAAALLIGFIELLIWLLG